jgi:uncharacterized membrane protein
MDLTGMLHATLWVRQTVKFHKKGRKMGYELIIATFENDESQAGAFLGRLKKMVKDQVMSTEGAAAVVKDQDGRVTVDEIGDVKGKRGAVFGAISGGIIGLFGGPVGAVVGAAAGAAAGGATAKIADYGVTEGTIKDIGKGLQPGSSALIAYVETQWVEQAVSRLENAGAVVVTEQLNVGLIDPNMPARPNREM